MTYHIVLRFQDAAKPSVPVPHAIWQNVTLEEAKKICNHPEASSRTATGTLAKYFTREYGNWFFSWTANE